MPKESTVYVPKLTQNTQTQLLGILLFIVLDMLLTLIQKISGASIPYMISPTQFVIVWKEYHIRFARYNLKLEDSFIIGSSKNWICINLVCGSIPV